MYKKLKLQLCEALKLNVAKMRIIIDLRTENLALVQRLKSQDTENTKLRAALLKLSDEYILYKATTGSVVIYS